MTQTISKKHGGGQRFSDYCPFCGKKPDNLTDHIRRHILEEDALKNTDKSNSDCLASVNNSNDEVVTQKEEDQLPEDSLSNLEPNIYDCEICGDSFKDFGAHLCFSHGMVKCSQDEHSNMYFEDIGELEKHMTEFHIEKKEKCSICWLVGSERMFSDLYALIEHKKTFHGLDYCVLCKYNSTNGEEFCKHMKQHNITNREVLNNEINEPLLLNHPLAKLNKTDMVVNCALCGERKETKKLLDYANKNIDVSDGGSRLWKHFMLIHKINNPHLVFLTIFNGEYFGFKNLIVSVVKEEQMEITDETNNSHVELMETNEQQSVNSELTKLVPKYVSSMEEAQIIRNLDKCDICTQISGRRGGIFKRHMQAHHVDIKFKECLKCNFIAFSKLKVTQHTERVHVNSVCSKCGLEKKRLKIHIKTCSGQPENEEDVNYDDFITLENNLFNCLHCGSKFDLYMKAYVHVYNLAKIGELGNTVVKVDFSNRLSENEETKLKIRRKRTWHGRTTKKIAVTKRCLECNLHFSSIGEQALHEKEVHRQNYTKEQRECQFCSQEFDSMIHKLNHERRHITCIIEKPKNFKCTYCEKAFKFQVNIRDHIRYVHTEIATIKCQECPKKFKSSTNLRAHVNRIHDLAKEFKFACVECDKKFYNNSDRAVHMISHTDIRIHPCDMCGKMFKRPGDVVVHQKHKHSSLKPYHCDLCEKVFSQSSNLYTHMRNMHYESGDQNYSGQKRKRSAIFKSMKNNVDLKKKISVEPVTSHDSNSSEKISSYNSSSIVKSRITKALDNCDICKQISGRRGGLFRRHVMFDHPNVKFKECSKCNFIAFKDLKITQHNERVHVNSVCSKCGMEKKRLNVHSKTCSGKPENDDVNCEDFITVENKIFQCLHCGLQFDLYMKAYVHVYNLSKMGDIKVSQDLFPENGLQDFKDNKIFF